MIEYVKSEILVYNKVKKVIIECRGKNIWQDTSLPPKTT
jgi:hypothetical protein